MNPKQLSILKLGIKYWNDWRKRHPKELIDLSDLDLSDQSLAGPILWDLNRNIANLSFANLSNVNLSNAVLEGVDFTGANLSNSNLSNSIFWDAILNKTDLSYADITGAYMVDANLTDASVYNIIYKKKSMKGKYRGIKVAHCYGSADFKEAALDQAYIDSIKAKIPAPIFWAWGFFSDFGRDFSRIGIFAIGWIFLFAGFYYLDFYFFGQFIDYKSNADFFTPLYHSFVIFFGLGDDATPMGIVGEIITVCQLIIGYFMQGLVLTVLARNFLPKS